MGEAHKCLREISHALVSEVPYWGWSVPVLMVHKVTVFVPWQPCLICYYRWDGKKEARKLLLKGASRTEDARTKEAPNWNPYRCVPLENTSTSETI